MKPDEPHHGNEKFPPDDLKRDALDFAAKISFDIERNTLSTAPSIIIGGAQRCGKSTIAKMISKDMKMFHLEADFVRDGFYGKLKGRERKWATTFIFKEMLTLFPRGVIIEGSVFSDDAKSVPIWAGKKGRNIPVYFIGNTSDYKSKYAAMLSFRKDNLCWTSQRFPSSDMVWLAKLITERSVTNKERCLKHGFTYFDIDPLNFERDLNAAATEIKRNI